MLIKCKWGRDFGKKLLYFQLRQQTKALLVAVSAINLNSLKNTIVGTCSCLGVWSVVLPKSTSVHFYVVDLLVLFSSLQFPSSEQLSGVMYSCSSILLLSGLAGPKGANKCFHFGPA